MLVEGADITAGTLNRLGRTARVVAVVVVDNDDGTAGRAGALVPKENCGGLSDETVEEPAVRAVVIVASGVLPNDPNVIDVGILIGDDAVVVIIEGTIGVLIVAAVVVVADVAEPNDGNVEDVLVLI